LAPRTVSVGIPFLSSKFAPRSSGLVDRKKHEHAFIHRLRN
jgi:hypothetical protein